jgi:hypothetical protein
MAILLVVTIASLGTMVGRRTIVLFLAIAFFAAVVLFLKILIGSSMSLLCDIVPLVTVAPLGTMSLMMVVALLQGLLSVDAIKTTNSEPVDTEALVGIMMTVFAHMSVTLIGTIAFLSTVVKFAVVFAIEGKEGALAVLLLAAIVLLVAIGLSALVGIVVVVVPVRAILFGITVATMVGKAVFAVRAMSVMAMSVMTVVRSVMARVAVVMSRAMF